MNVSFVPIWSWPVVLLCCAALAALVLMTYPRRIRHLSAGRRRVLLLLRLGLVALLFFLMLRPGVVLTEQDSSDAVLYVLNDVSRSMQTPDVASGGSRFEVQQELLADLSEDLQRLGKRVEIRQRQYADGLQEQMLQAPEAATTSLADTLEDVRQDSLGSRVAMLVLLGDGRQAATGNAGRSPIPLARQLGRQQTPVYTWSTGSSDLAATGLDVAVSELDLTRDVFERNVVPVGVRLRAVGAAGQRVRVRLLLEQLSPGGQAELRPLPADRQNRTVQEVLLDSDQVDQTLALQFVPEVAGEWKVAVEAVPLEGEVRPANNRIETMIRVRKGGIRVVYFDQERAESKWLRSVTIGNRVQLDFQPVRLGTGELAKEPDFDDSWFRPGTVDAYIIGDVPAEVFGEKRLQALYRCCQAGSGLMMTGGVRNFGRGGYQQTRAGSLLPVELPAEQPQLVERVRMLPTEQGLVHSVMQIGQSEVNRKRWEELPALNGATLLKVRDEGLAQVLARDEAGNPILVAHSVGRARVMVFAGDSTWHWAVRHAQGREIFNRFWTQTILWLTRKDQDTDAPVWVTADPPDVVPGQTVHFTMGARDSSGAAIADAGFEVSVLRPDGSAVTIPASRDGAQATAEFSETDQAGDYVVRVSATHGGRTAGPETARFLVNARDPELDNPSADPDMMRELAEVSGGAFLNREELLQRFRKWADQGLPGLQHARTQRINLWDNWYVLLLFAGLLTAEWVVRKKSGLV